jgi:two-component system chemotaxis response regulator CheY
MDGVDVLKRIRGMEQDKNVPESKRVKVVMVTARSDKDTIMTSIQAGCNDYVVKPFDKTIVAKKLTQLGFHVKLF